MSYQMILFDKDGTLLEFESTWIEIGNELIRRFAEAFEVKVGEKEIAARLGMEDNNIRPDGVLSSGTTNDVINILNTFTTRDVQQWTIETMNQLADQYEGNFTLIEGADDTLKSLKQQGFKLCVVTADDYEGTIKFLKKFNILQYFDEIITSDRSSFQKPQKEILNPLFQKYKLQKKEIIMVGDTPIDMKLGKNAALGLTIGVLSGTSAVKDLYEADLILNDLNEIINDNQLVWEGEQQC